MRDGGVPAPPPAYRTKIEVFSSVRKLFTCSFLCLAAMSLFAQWRSSARHTQPLHAPGRTSSGSRTQRRNAHTQSGLLKGTWHAPGPSPRVRVSVHSARFEISDGRDPEGRPPGRAARETRESSPDIFAIRRVDTLRGRAGAGKRPAATARAAPRRARHRAGIRAGL